MRKRNCNHLFDNIMWYTVYLLPIIITLIVTYSTNRTFTLQDWLSIDQVGYGDMGFWSNLAIACDNLGVDSTSFFAVIFRTLGTTPIFELGGANLSLLNSNSGLVLYLSYFCSVYILHLFVDFLIFIPRLCHKWMNGFTQGESKYEI